MKKIIVLLSLVSFVLPQFAAADMIEAPNAFLKVISPNGGEVLNRHQVQTIEWLVAVASPMKKAEANQPKVSIDLYKRVSQHPYTNREDGARVMFVKHIGLANLYDGSFEWRISPDIPNGKHYLIRVGLVRNSSVHPVEEKHTRHYATKLLTLVGWDESDSTFAIIGHRARVHPTVDESVVPALHHHLVKAIKTLHHIRQVHPKLAKAIHELQRLIAVLKTRIEAIIS